MFALLRRNFILIRRHTLFALLFGFPLLLLAQPLAGVLTIGGASPNYPTISAAVNDLAINGVGTGGVVFSIRPGTYNEAVTLTSILGTSENPITFQREMGVVTVAATGTSGADACIKIVSCQYVTFDDVDVENAGTSTEDYVEYGYHITNSTTPNGVVGSSHITVTNAAISTYRSAAAATVGLYQSVAVAPTSIEGSNRDNRYLNLQITNSFHGIFCDGNSTYHDANIEIGSTSSELNFSGRFKVGGFAVDDMGGPSSGNCRGIYVTYVEGVRIHDCDISNITATSTGSSVIGIYATNLYTTENYVSNNRINHIRNNSSTTTTATVYGIFVSPLAGANEVRVYNNFVANLNQSRTTEQTNLRINGIYCTTGTSGGAMSYIAYNSVLLNPVTTGGSNTCLYVSSGPATVLNNVFVNRTTNQTTARHFGIYANGSTPITCNYNDIFVANAGNGYVGYRSTSYATLDTWQIGSGLDLNSVTGDPLFADEPNGNLHITPDAVTPVSNAGTPLAWAVADIDGNNRSETTPDIGADEESPLLPPAAPVVNSILYENGNVSLSWDAVTGATGYRVYRSTDPYFSPSEVTLHATLGDVSSFSEILTGSEYYYRVTATNAATVSR